MKKSLKRISAMIFAVALVISLVPTTMAVDGTEDDEFTSQQYAETYPYMIFHPVDSPDYKEYYGKRFGYSGNVYSRKYKNSASKLCEEAWQVFYGSLVADKFDTVNIRSFKTVWPEK